MTTAVCPGGRRGLNLLRVELESKSEHEKIKMQTSGRNFKYPARFLRFFSRISRKRFWKKTKATV